MSNPTAEIEGASDRTAALKPLFPLHKMQQPLFPQLCCCCVLIVVSNVRAQAKKVSSFCLLIFFLFLKSSFSLFKSLQYACACLVFFVFCFALGNINLSLSFRIVCFFQSADRISQIPFLGKR